MNITDHEARVLAILALNERAQPFPVVPPSELTALAQKLMGEEYNLVLLSQQVHQPHRHR